MVSFWGLSLILTETRWSPFFQVRLGGKIVEIHLIPMDPVALTLKVEQKVALTGLAGLAR